MAAISQNRQEPRGLGSFGRQTEWWTLQGEATEKLLAEQVSEEFLRKVTTLVRRVANDMTFKVVIGDVGGGSYLSQELHRAVLDPLHILGKPYYAIFVPCHEGAHGAITLDPKELGYSSAEIEARYRRTGYGFIQNAVEDPAVNRWMGQEFPGLTSSIIAVYADQFLRDPFLGGAKEYILHTPETLAITKQLGFTPRFVRYASAIIRAWYEKKPWPVDNDDVQDALSSTFEHVERAWETLPHKGRRDRAHIRGMGQKRYALVDIRVWPEVEKLVIQDLADGAQASLGGKMLKKHNDIQRKKEAAKQATQQGKTEKAEQLSKEAENLQKELHDMANDAGMSIDELEKALEELADALERDNQARQNESAEKIKQARGALKDAAEKRAAADQALDKHKAAHGAHPSDAEAEKRKELEKRDAEACAKEKLAQQDLEGALKLGEGGFPQLTLSSARDGEQGIPIEKLSERGREALRRIFNALPESKRRELVNDVDRKLEDLEDKLNQALEPNPSRNLPRSHAARRSADQNKDNQHKQIHQARRQQQEAVEGLEELRRSRLDVWETEYEVVGQHVNEAFTRLRRVLIPQQNPDWEGGYSTGTKLDLASVMQAEADPRYWNRIWMRLGMPTQTSLAVELLCDYSTSMLGDASTEAFRGAVFLTELFDRLAVPTSVMRFGEKVVVMKEYHEKVQDEPVRNRLSMLRTPSDNNTIDAPAIDKAYARIRERPELFKFILVNSDAKSHVEQELLSIVEQIRRDSEVVLLHFGLGPGVMDTHGYYDWSFGGLQCAPSKAKNRRNVPLFSEVFTEVIEEIVIEPEKYLSGKKPVSGSDEASP